MRIPAATSWRLHGVLDADLQRLDRSGSHSNDCSQEMRRDFHAMLLYYARDRGYKPGWAAHKFKEKFGSWPPRHSTPEPIEPTAEVRAWIRSRQIAYAKGMEARANG